MRHPYPIREIARQAGLSTATVDRVLYERAHKALPYDGPALPSVIQVVTPFNMPPGTPSTATAD
ncbi:hypothetical protein ACWC2H_25195 [Streptomyces sp. 900105755]